MNKKLLSVGALFGLLAVAIGAFGAHGLEDKITAARIITFGTGVDYQFYHTFAIFIAVGLATYFKDELFLRAGWCFVIGILFFSGSLYLLATQTYLGIESWSKVIGPITPIGGLFFMAGWGILLFGIWRK
ncbi:MAG: DUF423 domain-containing protein [Saprospiraceae bacterium]